MYNCTAWRVHPPTSKKNKHTIEMFDSFRDKRDRSNDERRLMKEGGEWDIFI